MSEAKSILTAIMLPLALILSGVGGAWAQELVLGLGGSLYNTRQARDSAVLSVEWRGPGLGHFLGAEVMGTVAADLHARGDAFAGAGLLLRWQGGSGWFFDAGVMPGYYQAGSDGNDLGGHLQFRSQIGLGRWIGRTDAISLALMHKSNAHIRSHNPGMDSALLRWHRRF